MGGGVQLELPPRIRGLGPHWAGHPHGIDPGATAPPRAGLVPHTASLVDALADAATTWLT
ncbi:MAG: hypothetical protein U5R31_16370 [Acidimicrobiia bacterium]|nr:hypothetical protein [Acidimicrobiia bacterium]